MRIPSPKTERSAAEYDFPKQLPVLFHRLGEAETRIQDPVLNAMLLRLRTDSLEEIHDRSRDSVRIIGETGHGGRSPAHMHGHASENDKIKVYMQPDEVKKGIGRGGCNIKLAGMLVGREIEVWRELSKDEMLEEEDVLLSEFSNEIDQWVIERLESIGCDTAKSVLAFSPEDIAKRADLEDETVAEVFRILKAEFED